MNTSTTSSVCRSFAASLLIGLCFAAASVSAQTGAPSLGTAESFSVLAGSAVANIGPTVVVGNVGVSPGTSVTGFPPGVIVGGTIHANDAVSQQAQNDLTTAYNNLAAQPCDVQLTGQNLGGLTLTPGTYCFSISAQLNGTLTLDAQGNPNAVFIFQIGSTLLTASGSSIVLINGGNPCSVFFQVGNSAVLGTGSTFVGNILALTSITVTIGANVSGRVLARNGSIALDTNSIGGCRSAPPTAATVPVSGRVTTASGRGIRSVQITLTDAQGNQRIAQTTAFGYYRFDYVAVGETVTLSAKARQFRFNQSTIVRTTNDSITDADFVSEQ